MRMGGVTLAMLTVRNIPDAIHRALRMRAARNGRSMESEVRNILSTTLKSESNIKIGDALAAIGRRLELTNDDLEALERTRCEMPAEPMKFE